MSAYKSKHLVEFSPRLKARIAGALYALIFITAPNGAASVTAVKMLITLVCDASVADIFYDLFKPVNRSLSMLAMVFRLIFVAVMAVSSANYLTSWGLFRGHHSPAAFERGYMLALVFFGIHCVLIGCLIFRSTFLPRFLGVLLAIDGLGWILFQSPSLGRRLFPFIAAAAVLGEGLLTLWLLIMAVNAAKWQAQAGASPSSGA